MMKHLFPLAALLLCAFAASARSGSQEMSEDVEFNKIPSGWKWISDSRVVFTYDGTFTDEGAFSVDAGLHKVTEGVKAPAKFDKFPFEPEGAVNLTYSPDSSALAFTRDNDLYVIDIASGKERRLTFDGSDLVLNGFASWVYYEEILGRPSKYKAFWWSPDSKKIGFYRFDNAGVPMFPIYSAVGQDGTLNRTRYPKAGEKNPEVRIGIIDISSLPAETRRKTVEQKTVWADFDSTEDQYFGIPFWGPDSKSFYIAREPRIQNTLDLYRVDVKDGSKELIYNETYKTWLDWIEEVIFTDRGLYMARSFETGWEQIYFLSYDGREFRRLTDGNNRRISLVRVDEKEGCVYFTANRDAVAKSCFYKVDPKGVITALTDPEYAVSSVRMSPDGKHFVAALSNTVTPTRIWLYETAKADLAWKARKMLENAQKGKRINDAPARTAYLVADSRGGKYDPSEYALPVIITIKAEDGLEIPAAVTYPRNFDPSKKYPVHFEIYGGPNTAYVRDMWVTPNYRNQWWSGHDIIHVVADSRAAGHNGRAGTDLVYRNLTDVPVKDFVAWAEYFRQQPYVDPDRIGVEGFSFGGTMTAMLLFRHSDVFRYGIAGGGVYDWMLYDSHYTERFMETPQTNPDGYAASKVLAYVKDYPVEYGSDGSVMLKLTHGTGDDNVHFQNTLQLVDELQRSRKAFELMIYPDGMHGYRGAQGMHSLAADHEFWLKYLKGE